MSDDDYGFEYSDDDQEEEDVNIENRYYNAKGDLADDVEAALAGFKEVVTMEDEKGEWGFKARDAARRRTLLLCSPPPSQLQAILAQAPPHLAPASPQAYKQMVKLHFKRGKHDLMMGAYKQMLTYIKSAVTRNYSEKVRRERCPQQQQQRGCENNSAAPSTCPPPSPPVAAVSSPARTLPLTPPLFPTYPRAAPLVPSPPPPPLPPPSLFLRSSTRFSTSSPTPVAPQTKPALAAAAAAPATQSSFSSRFTRRRSRRCR